MPRQLASSGGGRSRMTTLVVAGPSGLSRARRRPSPSRAAVPPGGRHGRRRALGPEHEVVSAGLREASMDELARVHDPAYLAGLASFCAEGGGDIDADTYARPDSWTAAGAPRGPGWPRWRARAARRGRRLRPGPAARPPRDRRPRHGLLPGQQRRRRRGLAHGARASGSSSSTGTCTTGTAPRTSSGTTPTCSTSRPINIPSIPGTGRPDEVGGPARPGLTAQPPVAAGGDRRRGAGRARPGGARQPSRNSPRTGCWSPAGSTPTGTTRSSDLQLSSGDFAELARIVREFAPRPGRLALFLEGGYHQAALASSVEATLGALVGGRGDSAAPTTAAPGWRSSGPTASGAPSTVTPVGTQAASVATGDQLGCGARAPGSARW